jgi:hypothetical protein|tara:strand:+ start:317 stop:511 length:195 start_codon:yes stop_codon:yes gene_type:complete
VGFGGCFIRDEGLTLRRFISIFLFFLPRVGKQLLCRSVQHLFAEVHQQFVKIWQTEQVYFGSIE